MRTAYRCASILVKKVPTSVIQTIEIIILHVKCTPAMESNFYGPFEGSVTSVEQWI